MPKAYIVYDLEREWGDMVFAETPGKAKIHSELAGNYEFTDLRAKRKPKFDKYAEQGFVPERELILDGWGFEWECDKCGRMFDITASSLEDNQVKFDENGNIESAVCPVCVVKGLTPSPEAPNP